MKRLLKRKGFTLVELIVSMAIFGLLVAAAMAMFGPVQSIVSSLDADVTINATTDTLSGYIYGKMNKTVTYNIEQYDDVSLMAGASTDGSAAKRIAGMISDIEDASIESTYCMLIRPETDGYRLYDLGAVTAESFTSVVNDATKLSRYALFSDHYYGDVDYRFTFSTTPQDAQNNEKKWCRIGVTAFDQDGNVVVEERAQMFKLLNMEMNNLTPYSAPELEKLDNPGYDGSKTIVIIYRIKDYSKL